MPRKPKNLSLDPEAVRRAERYSERHATNVSELVNSYVSRLPVDEPDWRARLTPAVMRLLGAGKGKTTREDYREHLQRKYG